jgi:hypothetical protein
LGVLSNMPGEAKGVACIEDTAVEVTDLPAYITDFEEMMAVTDKNPCTMPMPAPANCICARSSI